MVIIKLLDKKQKQIDKVWQNFSDAKVEKSADSTIANTDKPAHLKYAHMAVIKY